jgi:hypothetical protein
MCITAKPSIMSNTLIYTGEGTYKDKYVHVLAYQNVAENIHDEPNAMILPFPTNQLMTQDNIIDTSNFKRFLIDIADATRNHYLSDRMSKGLRLGSVSKAIVFDSGSYTVVLANDISGVPDALQLVQESKRPWISTSFLEGYNKLYPEQPIAICCWESKVKAEPLLWWYEPADKSKLFAPTMDSHDGFVPDKEAFVEADHVISAGSSVQNYAANKVHYRDSIPDDVMTLLPLKSFGTKIENSHLNGDMWLNSNLTEAFPLLKRGDFLTKKASPRVFKMNGWE